MVVRVKIVDASSLLHLRSPLARSLVALIIVTQCTFAVFGMSLVRSPWPSIVGLAVFMAGALVMARPHGDPFPIRWTLWVLSAGALTNALVLWNLPLTGWPGYAAWNFGAVTWLLFFLAFRGRIGAAWLGLAIMAALTVGWALSIGRGALEGVDLVIRHAGTLLMGTLFSVLLRRVSARMVLLQNESVKQAGAEVASFTELHEREIQAQQLAAEARPVLERIAGGETADDARRQEYALLEASLRDTLRGHGLSTARVASAVLAARRRGSEVVLLDDRNVPLPSDVAAEIEGAILEELSTLTDGRMTVRLLPVGRDLLATLVRSDSVLRRRREFPS